MVDLLLLIHGLMKVALVVGVMLLVATAPTSAAVADRTVDHPPSAQSISSSLAGGMSDDTGAVHLPAFDQAWHLEAGRAEPDQDHWRNESARVSATDDDHFPRHTMNVDGTPMFGNIDINGNSWGITESHFDDWRCGGISSEMFD